MITVTRKQNKRALLGHGFSLIECLIIILITTTLMSFCYNSFQGFLMRQERARFLSSLKEALTFARSTAFFKNSTVTLCGSHSHQRCHLQKDWSSGFIVFENSHENPNHETEPDPARILRIVPGIHYGKLIFNGTSPLIHIGKEGLTMNIGTFLYCPHPPLDQKTEWDGLVLNRAFRAYCLSENLNKVETLECR